MKFGSPLKTTHVSDIVSKPHAVFILFLIGYQELHIETKEVTFPLEHSQPLQQIC